MDDAHRAAELWTVCSRDIRRQVSDVVWHTTFAAIQPFKLDDAQFTIRVGSVLVKERIEGRYLALLRGAVNDAGMADINLTIVVDTTRT